MLNYLIVDPAGTMPSLYLVLSHGNEDSVSYYYNSKKSSWSWGPYRGNELPNMYGFETNCLETPEDREQISNQVWDAMFVVFPLKPPFHGNFQNSRDYLVGLIKDIQAKSTVRQLVLIDNSDECLDFTDGIREAGLDPTVVFKREYNPQVENYTDLFIPFPYVVLGFKDSLWLANERKWFKPVGEKLDRVYYAGSRQTVIDPNLRIFHNRKKLLEDCADLLTIQNPVSGRQYANDSYMAEMSKSKFCLYPRGGANLTRRLLEIMSVGSLAIIQRNGITMNFSGDGFAREVYFDLPEELRRVLSRLRNDPDLYAYCLAEQNRVLEENFTYESVKKYILKYIKRSSET